MIFDAEFWGRLLGILVIDLTLAGDNALVIAMAVRSLPPRQQTLGRVWGTAGAAVLRLFFIAIATFVLKVPGLQLLGGLLLVWIAIKLVRQPPAGEEHVRHGTSLREAVWTIIAADTAMSLDNVLAVAAAAHGDFTLVALGIAVSLPLVVWGSGVLAWFMGRWPSIIWVGAGILGWVAGEMIVREPFVGARIGRLHLVLSGVLAIGLTVPGWWYARRARLAEERRETTRTRAQGRDYESMTL
jgi:YjbE family integral membrane protein